jgi:hypothetical protein
VFEHLPRVWPAAMMDHPSYTGDGRAWIVLCPCRPYSPVITGDELAEIEQAAADHAGIRAKEH